MNQNYGHPRSTSGPDSSLAVSSPCRYNEDRFLREGDAMPMQVCMGAMMQCSFGLAPSSLVVLPVHRTMTNIMPFGMCTSGANPMVAAATAAAMGVLTPMPCIPNTPAPWVPGGPTVLLDNMPTLDDQSKLMCIWGGVIQFVTPGEFTVQVP